MCKKKRMISLVLSLCMVVTMTSMPVSATEMTESAGNEPEVAQNAEVAAQDAAQVEESQTTPLADITGSLEQPAGDGTEENPYQIANAANLYWFACLVNGGTEGITQNRNAHAILTADITLNENVQAQATTDAEVETFTNWTPIGQTSAAGYNGTFDGAAHTIHGLYYFGSGANVGLFGYTNTGAEIKNITLEDSFIRTTGDYAGGIVGVNYGVIEGCDVKVNIRADSYAGGIVGTTDSNTTISYCKAYGNIMATWGYGRSGGIAGESYGAVNYCYSACTVGRTSSSIYDSYAGGIVGRNEYHTGNAGTVTGCLSESTIQNAMYQSGIACNGDRSEITISDSYYNRDKCNSATATGGGTVERSGACSTADIMSGQVCYLLNNMITDGTQKWYQKLGEDVLPVWDAARGTVYVLGATYCDGTSADGETVYSNTAGETVTIHKSTKKVDRVDPTEFSTGTEEYYQCETCKKYFSDAEGTQEIEAPSIIPATPHSYDAQGICTQCGMRKVDGIRMQYGIYNTTLKWEVYDTDADETGDTIVFGGTGTIPDLQYIDVKLRTTLKQVQIMDGVTSIGEGAFDGCSSLSSIELPSSVTSIGDSAFSACYSLSSIELPSTVKSVGDSAFRNCYSLSSIELPSSVTSIGDSAFRDCSDLTSVELPSSVTSIGDSAFQGCNSLTSIELPSTVKSIGQSAFSECSSLSSIELPSTVTSIGQNAFSGCSSLTSIELPATLESIGDCAFSDCSSLTSIKLPSKVTSIGDYAFAGCSSLTSIELPATVTSIVEGVFSSCYKLSSIELPVTLESIGDYAFTECSSLTSIELPSKVTSIGDYAFAGCSSLTSIELPSTLTGIGIRAFDGCSSLSSIELPSTVTRIYNFAFFGCSSLTRIYFMGSAPTIDYDSFSLISSYPEEVILFYPADDTSWNSVVSQENWGSLPGGVIWKGRKTNTITTTGQGGICKPWTGSAIDISTQNGEDITWNDTVTASVTGYYTDAAGTVKTTSENSGALSEGGAPANLGTYYVRIKLQGNDDYMPLSDMVAFIIEKETPTITELSYTAPENLVYDSNAKEAAVTAKEGVTGLGAITVKYKAQGTENYLASAPTEAGAYEVYVSIAEGTDYAATKEDLKVGSFTIIKKYTVSLTSRVDNAEDDSTVALLTGGGSYEEGTSVIVQAPKKDGYEFLGWYQADNTEQGYTALADEKLSYTFLATAETSLVAVYRAKAEMKLTITGAHFQVNGGATQTSGNYSESFKAGTRITLVATGENFAYWMNESSKIVSTSANYSFNLVGNTTYTPVYKNAEANSAFVEFVSHYGQIIQAEAYKADDAIILPDGPSKVGYTFDGWSQTAEQIQAAIAKGTTYIKVMPVYKAIETKYSVTVKYAGAGELTEEVYENLAAGSTMTLNAEAVEGKRFKCWASDSAGTRVLGTEESYFMQLSSNVTMYAIYVDASETVIKVPTIVMTNKYAAAVNGINKVSFVATRTVPEGYTLIEQGMLYSKEGSVTNPTADTFIVGGENIYKYTSSDTTAKGVFTMNIKTPAADTLIYARAYMVVTNNSTGNDEIIYSDLDSSTFRELNN